MPSPLSPAILTLGLLMTPALAVAQEAASPGLPGDAQSLNEEHGDWTVSCRVGQAEKLCVMSQTLADSDSGRPVLSLELAIPASDRAEGMLLLPFGLRLAAGASFKVDGASLSENRPFLTCVATGCLVPVIFEAAQLGVLRAGTELVIAGVSAGSGEPIELKVSLSGFSRAADRSLELGR